MTEVYRNMVRTYFDMVSQGDLADALLTPDMTAWTTTLGTVDKVPYQQGVKLLRGMCARPLVFTIDSLTAEDDRVVAEVRSEGTLINGEEYRNTYVVVFRFRDGRIASVAEHFNAIIVNEKLMPLFNEMMAKAKASGSKS